MVPDFELRIQAMIRSLREVILPALPSTQMLAIDQANILIGYLRIMAQQHENVYGYLLAELADYAALVDAMVERPGDGQSEVTTAAREARDRARHVLEMSIPRQRELAEQVKSLKTYADALLDAARRNGSASSIRGLTQLVMVQAGRQIRRERAWFRASGFELDADKVPPIEEVLYGGDATPRA